MSGNLSDRKFIPNFGTFPFWEFLNIIVAGSGNRARQGRAGFKSKSWVSTGDISWYLISQTDDFFFWFLFWMQYEFFNIFVVVVVLNVVPVNIPPWKVEGTRGDDAFGSLLIYIWSVSCRFRAWAVDDCEAWSLYLSISTGRCFTKDEVWSKVIFTIFIYSPRWKMIQGVKEKMSRIFLI